MKNKKTQHITVWTDFYFTEHENKHHGGASVVCIQELSGQLAFEHIKMFIYNNIKIEVIIKIILSFCNYVFATDSLRWNIKCIKWLCHLWAQ